MGGIVPMPMTAFAYIRPPDALVIAKGEGNPIVTVHADGKVTLAEGYEPDRAASIFWDAVERAGLGRTPAPRCALCERPFADHPCPT